MSKNLNEVIVESLDDLKGKDIVQLDVKGVSDVADTLIIVTGTSNRHVKSLANNALLEVKQQGFTSIGIEGMDAGEWVLVDYGDTVLHIMLQEARDFYEHFGFEPSPIDPLKLMLLIKDARKTIY